MDQARLSWEGPFTVPDLRKKLFEERMSEVLKDPTNYWMTWPGVYVFLDQSFRVLYVGSGTKSSGNALRSRIREHLNGQTDFSRRLKDNKMDISALQVIVAPFTNDEHFGEVLKRERNLLLELNPPGNSDDVEIVNNGNYRPLPEKIRIGLSKMR